MQNVFNASSAQISSLEVSKVLRNTYALLAMTLLFSAVTAGISMAINPPHMVSMIMSFGAIGVIWFVLPKTANSSAGIWVVFAFTGMLGFGLGPMLNHYLSTSSGSAIVTQALGGTALIFFGMSGYALVSRKDFSFMTGFLMTGIMVAFIAAIANIFFQIPALQLAVSSVFLVVSSLLILWQTSRIIHGGETNYIMATASLYISIYNVFVSLLQLLSAFNDD